VIDFADTSDDPLDSVETFDLLDASVLSMVLLTDWGQMPELPKGAVWRRYLHNFASASKYRSVVDHYLAFHEVQGNCSEETLSENVGNYFEHERSFHKRKSSTLRSRFSALKKFFLHTARRDIAKEQTLVESNFAKWDKVDTTKQSAVFLKEHYGTYVYSYTRNTHKPFPTTLSILQWLCSRCHERRTRCCTRQWLWSATASRPEEVS